MHMFALEFVRLKPPDKTTLRQAKNISLLILDINSKNRRSDKLLINTQYRINWNAKISHLLITQNIHSILNAISISCCFLNFNIAHRKLSPSNLSYIQSNGFADPLPAASCPLSDLAHSQISTCLISELIQPSSLSLSRRVSERQFSFYILTIAKGKITNRTKLHLLQLGTDYHLWPFSVDTYLLEIHLHEANQQP